MSEGPSRFRNLSILESLTRQEIEWDSAAEIKKYCSVFEKDMNDIVAIALDNALNGILKRIYLHISNKKNSMLLRSTSKVIDCV